MSKIYILNLQLRPKHNSYSPISGNRITLIAMLQRLPNERLYYSSINCKEDLESARLILFPRRCKYIYI